MKNLQELASLPISTNPADFKNRIDIVLGMISSGVKATNAEFAEALCDVITYQSYAGELPIDT